MMSTYVNICQPWDSSGFPSFFFRQTHLPAPTLRCAPTSCTARRTFGGTWLWEWNSSTFATISQNTTRPIQWGRRTSTPKSTQLIISLIGWSSPWFAQWLVSPLFFLHDHFLLVARIHISPIWSMKSAPTSIMRHWIRLFASVVCLSTGYITILSFHSVMTISFFGWWVIALGNLVS